MMKNVKNLNRYVQVVLLSLTAVGCIENTSYVTQERSDKVEQYLLKKEPKVGVRLDAQFEDKVILLGYDVKGDEPKLGDIVEITWYWKVNKPVGAGWRLFTHGMNEAGEASLNADMTGPVRKNFQPEHWRAGMIVKDTQRIRIPNNWADSRIEFRTGIWKGSDRLKGRGKHFDSGNRVIGPRIKITGKKKPPVSIPYATVPPVIDGKFEGEEAWKGALKLDPFVNTMNGRAVPTVTNVYLMWDADHLYVAAEAKDDNLKSPYTEHDDELWKADAFEMFLDPKGDKKDYYELQVNPKGVIFDSHLPQYRKNQNEWSSNMTAVVVMDGTLNDESDTDKGWTIEIAVPFASMTAGGGSPPNPGDSWAINFFRVDATKSDKKVYSAWSPPMRGDFHTLARFGKVFFQKQEERKTAPEASPSPTTVKKDAPQTAPEADKKAAAAKTEEAKK